MARWIDADALIAHEFKNDISYKAFCNLVKRQPTADVAPVRRGKWVKVGHIEHTYLVSKCSACGGQTIDAGPYCPNCGAKMDGERDG